jgi:hypothetical protein
VLGGDNFDEVQQCIDRQGGNRRRHYEVVEEILRAERKRRQLDVAQVMGEIDARKMNPYVMNLRQMMRGKRGREEKAHRAQKREEEVHAGVTVGEQLDRLCSKYQIDR